MAAQDALLVDTQESRIRTDARVLCERRTGIKSQREPARFATDLVSVVAGDAGEVSELELDGGHLGRATVRAPARRMRRVRLQVHVREGNLRLGVEGVHQPVRKVFLQNTHCFDQSPRQTGTRITCQSTQLAYSGTSINASVALTSLIINSSPRTCRLPHAPLFPPPPRVQQHGMRLDSTSFSHRNKVERYSTTKRIISVSADNSTRDCRFITQAVVRTERSSQ